MPPQTRKSAGAKKVRRKEKKNVAHGHAHIKSTFNNTIVSITDPMGNVISWASAGHVGFKGSRRGRCQEGPPQGEEERRARCRAHQEHLQQHDRLDHRPERERDQLGLRRSRRLQGLPQVHAVRRADGRRERGPQGAGARHAQGRRLREGPRFGPRDRHPVAAGHGPRGRPDPGRHPPAAQRLPPQEAPPGLTGHRRERR
jgi:hypothetical protein